MVELMHILNAIENNTTLTIKDKQWQKEKAYTQIFMQKEKELKLVVVKE